MTVESWTLSLFMAGPKSKKLYISSRNRRETTNFGEKGLLVCRHVYFGKQLLPQINDCCREMLQNNEDFPMVQPLLDACSI